LNGIISTGTYGDITETTVESVFGVNAGFVWEALNQNGPGTIEYSHKIIFWKKLLDHLQISQKV
jgi:hypothetical protein